MSDNINDELIKRLRVSCESCKLWDGYKCCLKGECSAQKSLQAADAIEELQGELQALKGNTDMAIVEDGKTTRLCFVKKWIPVTERLPEEDGKYLTVHTLNSIPPQPWIEVCWFAKDLYKVDKYDFHDKKKKSGFYQYDSEWGNFERTGISHWMPLPKPPEGEGE